MRFSDMELPSNRKFGFFFTAIFAVLAAYFALTGSTAYGWGFAGLASIFLAVTLIKADLLLPLNKLWMRFGFLLGLIMTPLTLGLIFFLLFTPIALVLRLIGRDELRLKFGHQKSHWIMRDTSKQSESFKHQF